MATGLNVAQSILLVTVCAASISCSSRQASSGQAQSTDVSGVPGVPGRYAFLFDGYQERVLTQPEVIREGLPYESISISRKGCEGTCPVYAATLQLDGSASLDGQRFVEHVGRFTGKVSLFDFGQLCFLVERSGFMKLNDRYATPRTDDQTVTVTVKFRKGEAKVVADYGRFGPPDLWVLERAIDGVVNQIHWTPAQ